MTEDLYKQQARRARELAEKADPFIKRRLLDLADKYDAKTASSPRASRMTEGPLPRTNPVSGSQRSGEA